MLADIVTKYIYYQESQPATPADMRESEILDSHFRESLVRVRELLLLTRHELRLRGPFDPLPFAALINACEGYFNDLYVVRQCALFYAADFVRAGDGAKKILGFRRDSIASMLTNLYVLSGALYAGSKVPVCFPQPPSPSSHILFFPFGFLFPPLPSSPLTSTQISLSLPTALPPQRCHRQKTPHRRHRRAGR